MFALNSEADDSHVNSDYSPVILRPITSPNHRSHDADITKNAGRSKKHGISRRDLLPSFANESRRVEDDEASD